MLHLSRLQPKIVPLRVYVYVLSGTILSPARSATLNQSVHRLHLQFSKTRIRRRRISVAEILSHRCNIVSRSLRIESVLLKNVSVFFVQNHCGLRVKEKIFITKITKRGPRRSQREESCFFNNTELRHHLLTLG